MENFVVSARKYRPSTFDTVVGQRHITTTLKNAIQNNHLAQAFLFCGPRGVGKTTNARILAKTINCQNLTQEIEPCNECDSCKSFNNSHSFNIHELDAASNNSVEDIRSLVEQVRYPPQAGKYKIYIIDEVHMLSNAAFNAFLKTLEEPPSYAIFILATTEKHKIIPTILSRCQIFDFNRIQIKDISEHLQGIATKEKIEAEEEALNLIAQKADGALRDALSMFDLMVTFSSDNTIRYKNVIDNLHILDYDYYFKITDLLLQNRLAEVLVIYDEILKKGFDGHHFIVGLAEHFRNVMVCKDKITIDLLEVGKHVKAQYLDQSDACSLSFLLSALSISSKCDQEYKNSKNQRLHVELTLMKICYLQQAIEFSQEPIQTSTPVEEKKNINLEQIHSNEIIPKQEIVQQKSPVSPTPPSNKKVISNFKPITNIPTSSTDVQKPIEKTVVPPLLKNLGTTPFSTEQALQHWKNYVKAIDANIHASLHIALNRNISSQGNLITLAVDNQYQIDLVNQNKEPLLRYLKQQLNNSDVILQIKVQQRDTSPPTRTFTGNDNYKNLVEKNPLLEQFRKELGLEINF